MNDADLSVTEAILVTFNNLGHKPLINIMRYVTLSTVIINNKKYRWNEPTSLSSTVIVTMPFSKMIHHTKLHIAIFRQTGDKKDPYPINPYQHITRIKP